MDWKILKLSLEDMEYGRTKYLDAFSLMNITRRFGEKTDYQAIKIILRPIYKELRKAVKDREEIPGIISDERFKEIVHVQLSLIEHYYWNNRFRDEK
jgi:hypothetical protein